MDIEINEVQEIIKNLDGSGELSIKEEKYLNVAKPCVKLAAENAGLNVFIEEECFVYSSDTPEPIDANDCKPETPATDDFLAEVLAQGVDMAMEHMQSSGSLTFGDCYISLNEFAAQLRKGAEL